MAFIRKRANGKLSLVFWWQGKSYTKALGTRDEGEAEQLKKDAETQLDRIRKGKAPLAARLLEEGFAITDVLFGSPQIGARIGQTSDGETPLPLGELAKG